MGPKRTGIKRITEQDALGYFSKAQEFYQTMTEAYRQRQWNSAGLAGVHCVISATDALLGKKARLRSSGTDHYQTVTLLRQHIQSERTKTQADRLARILTQKSGIEYDSREFTESEASSLVKDVGRYLEWVQSFFVG